MWALGSLAARAEDTVLLRERAGIRPGLCVALRIQLSGVGEVRCEPDPGNELLSERIAESAARVRELGARLGVLLERDPDPGLLRMYLVSARNDQAVIAIEPIEDRPEPDVDRSLALKVRDAYDVVAVVRATAPEATMPLSATVAMGEREVQPARPGAQRRLFLDAGGGVSLGSATRAVANLVLGLSFPLRGTRKLELGAGARLTSDRDEKRPYGHVSAQERGALVSARLMWSHGRFEIGGALEGMLSIVSAEGVAQDSSRGRDTLITPVIGLGAEVRVRLFPAAYLRVSPIVELATIDRRLAVDDRTLVDDGPLRVTLPVSLVLSLPLGREPELIQP